MSERGEKIMVTPEEYEKSAREAGLPEELIKMQKKYIGKKIEGAPIPQKTEPPEEQMPQVEYEIAIESDEALDEMNICAHVDKKSKKITIQKNCKQIKVRRY